MNVTIQPQTVKISIGSKSMGIGIESPIAREIINCDPYIGEYEITPNNELQILPTKNLRMLNNVVINPIPDNYGLITWNGEFLIVS